MNLGLKFLIELAAIAAFAYWGATATSGLAAVAIAIAAPAVAVVLWGTFAAPKSERRLPTPTRVPFELAVFAMAVAALLAAGSIVAACLLGVAVMVNVCLTTLFHQWAA